MEVFDKVVSMIAEQLGIDKSTISLESEVIKDLGADSLDIVQMLMCLEDEFGITVSVESASSLKTVKDIVELIEK